MSVHDFVKAHQLVKLGSDPKLEKLQSAQGKLEAAAQASARAGFGRGSSAARFLKCFFLLFTSHTQIDPIHLM